MPRFTLPVALPAMLCALAIPYIAHAQNDNRVLVKAGADGRFEMLIDTTQSLRGHAPPKVAAFRARVDEVVALLKAMPAVSAPPYPSCSRLDSWLARNDIKPVLMASVGVQTPEVSQPGRCDRRSEMSVRIEINQLSEFLPSPHAIAPEGQPRDWYVLPVHRQGADFIALETDDVLYFEAHGTPLRPVTTERYARYQLSQLTSNGAHDGGELGALYRKRIASWTPAQRARPACVIDPAIMPNDLEDVVIDAVENCPPQRIVVEIDEGYLDSQRPAAIQTISISNPPRAGLESDGSWKLRSTIWSTIDHAALRAQLQR